MPILCPAMKPCTPMVSSGARLLAGIRTPTATTMPWRSRSRTMPASSCSKPRTCTTCSTASNIRCWRTVAYAWNDAGTTAITFKLKPAAKWSDGTPVTADDVAYTWATSCQVQHPHRCFEQGLHRDHRSRGSPDGCDQGQAGRGRQGGQSADRQCLRKHQLRHPEGLDPEAGRAHRRRCDQVAGRPRRRRRYSGPYHKFFADDSKVVYVRDDNYWGQDASMWGKLPAPKYLAHTIFKDNAAGSVALSQGEVDVSQQFNSNVQVLWENYGLPISTYLPEAALWHRRQPPDRLLQPEVPRVWTRSRSARPSPSQLTTPPSSPTR